MRRKELVGDSIDGNSATEFEGLSRIRRFDRRTLDLMLCLFRYFHFSSSVAVNFEQKLQVINSVRK